MQKNALKNSNKDFDKFIEERRKHYETTIRNNPEKASFKNGWENRLKAIEEYAKSLK